MNRISRMKDEQIITLWQAGKEAVWIAEQLGIHRETVSEHLKKAGFILPRGRPPSGGRKPSFTREVPTDSTGSIQNRQLRDMGCPPSNEYDSTLNRDQNRQFSGDGGVPNKGDILCQLLGQTQEERLVGIVSGTTEVKGGVKVTATLSACEPHREFIEGRVGRGQSAQVIWQDMVDELGINFGYDSVKRFVKGLRMRSPEVFAVIPTEPGYEAQVDYGRGAPTRHPETGKLRRPHLFSMKLSHSRKAFRKVVWKSSSRIWCELHEEGFRYLGGVPKTIRLDNLKEGVLVPDLYDPELNPLYASMLAHYGCTALPCRVATPRHKGKVESDIKYTQNALKGREFELLEEQQKFIEHWSNRWADTRIHGTIKRQVKEVYETEEKNALLPLPLTNFPILQIAMRKVHSDGHIKVDNVYYSAPSSWVHKEVTVHVGRSFVDLYNPSTGERLARHLVGGRGRYQTNSEHLPEAKRLDNLHDRLIRKSQAIGDNTAKVVKEILRQKPYHAIRSVQGIISLTKKYSKEVVENAAKHCSEREFYTYRGMKQLVEREGLLSDKNKYPELTQTHHLIRESDSYRQLWINQTGEN